MVPFAPFARILLLAGAVALSGCASVPPASPTSTPEPQPTPTATFVFPTLIPTATVTAVPSSTMPPALVAGAGPLLFQAAFSPDEGWRLSSDADGGASLSGGSLVIAVSRPNASRYVLAPGPPAVDFRLEAEVRAGLCGAADEVGILFRVGPLEEHYRLTLTCQGQVRVTRVLSNGAAVLAGPADAPSAIPGSPAVNRLRILARGDDFTFYINDVEVLRADDPYLLAGGYGFFVRSASQGQTTAALTALSVYALQPEASPTPAPE